MADCRQGTYLNAGTADNALCVFNVTPEGFSEYTASNFSGSLKGVLFAACWDGEIARINLTSDGTAVTNTLVGTEKLYSDAYFDSNLPVHPLYLLASGDNDPFPGTMWLASLVFGNPGLITVYEPSITAPRARPDRLLRPRRSVPLLSLTPTTGRTFRR